MHTVYGISSLRSWLWFYFSDPPKGKPEHGSKAIRTDTVRYRTARRRPDSDRSILSALSCGSTCFDIESLHPSDLSKSFMLTSNSSSSAAAQAMFSTTRPRPGGETAAPLGPGRPEVRTLPAALVTATWSAWCLLSCSRACLAPPPFPISMAAGFLLES